MSKPLLIGLIAGFAAWTIVRRGSASPATVPVEDAVSKLQEAWADHHTTV